MAPSTTKQWVVEGQNGFESLKFNEKAPVPEIGGKDVLVKSRYHFDFVETCATLMKQQFTLPLSTTAISSFPRGNTHSPCKITSYPVQTALEQ